MSDRKIAASLPPKMLPLATYTLSYREAGDSTGRLVVFVHGTPGEAGGWADYLMAVPAGYHYVAIDRPGFGQSGPKQAVTSLPEQAAAVAALIHAKGDRPAILVGHSLGGPIIAQTAADHPEKVAALIIVAGSLDPAQEDVPFIQHVGDTWLFGAVLPRMIRNANREIIALKPQLTALAPRLATIKCPVTIIHGTKDELVPFANVAFMEKHLTGAAVMQITVLTGLNHFLPWNSRDKIAAAIVKLTAATPVTDVR